MVVMSRAILVLVSVCALGMVVPDLAGGAQAKEGIWTNPVSEEGIAVISKGDVWSYFAATGDPSLDWKLGKGTSGWKSGPTHIGYDDNGSPGLSTVFTTGPSPSSRYPVAYFRRAVTIPAIARGKDLRLSVDCDDGCIVYVNGTEVGRVRVPAGPVKPYTAKLSGRDWAKLFVPTALFKPRGNVIAVEVHQVDAKSSDMRFSAMLHTDDVVKSAPAAMKSDTAIVQITLDGQPLSDWRLLDVPVDYADLSRMPSSKADSELCLKSTIDRACHRLAPGQTGIWNIEYNRKTYKVRLER
ncbi:hypothetical protein SAMN05428974_0594 [Sphingopyxis sp. YR583]|nr:hypothetical protein SAMN05428974_0594 [Sphingopyxis sp. YR583]